MAGCKRDAFARLVSRTPKGLAMTWKPDRRQIDLIADHCAANMPLAATAAALDVHPDDLRAWGSFEGVGKSSLQQRALGAFLSDPHRQHRPLRLATGRAGFSRNARSRRNPTRISMIWQAKIKGHSNVSAPTRFARINRPGALASASCPGCDLVLGLPLLGCLEPLVETIFLVPETY
jgi:hypothetical protein